MVYVHNSDELYHYGVKGMRWGHRKASYQNTAVKTGNSAQRQKYLDAKANKKAANKAYTKAFNKAYNRNFAMLSPIKKHRDANNERWNDAAEKGKKSYEADQAYKQAKKEYKQTDEYKAKRAKAIKVGAAVAGTALAAYGAYKVSKIMKNKAAMKSMTAGKVAADRWVASARKAVRAGDINTANVLFGTAEAVGKSASERTAKVSKSTVEAAKYLWKTRRS